jgi:isoleucyl-tRNA synthetase
MERVARAFEDEGIEAWYRREPGSFTNGATCAKCGKGAFRREQDILDVWWDSGVSWSAVAEREGQGVPVDLYLEGSDQHRGWFHSSLLTSCAIRGAAPYRGVLTHGFVLDGQGKAMSKSAGNGIEPEEIIKKYGADVLRLWVAASDYRDDVALSEQILSGLAEGYRKIRNTIRYALGNLADFDPAKDAVAPEELLPLDRWALARLAAWDEKVKAAYEDYEFHVAYHATVELCAVELSAVYFDVLKDRLYTAKKDGKARRSAQTVLWIVAQDLIRLLAPILSFTASEAWAFLPGAGADSPFLAGLPKRDRPKDAEALEARYGKIFEVRAAVQGKLEEARRAKLIGSGLEAMVTLRAEGDTRKLLEELRADLPALFIVSKVVLADASGALQVDVARAPGVKCERCWVYAEDVGASKAHPTVCGKCASALE